VSPIIADVPTRAPLALIPVVLFLLGLIYLDSYKLVGLRTVAAAIAGGAAAAVVCYWINNWISGGLHLSAAAHSKYGSPVVEEAAKALPLIYLIWSRRVGFLVDAAIYGFAVGAGFAVVENIHYLVSVPEAGLSVWMIRGFGTATMHGCAGALFAIVSKLLSETRPGGGAGVFLPGLLGAIAAHSLHNHFIVPPLLSTAGIMLVFPGLVFLVFRRSERSLQHWLGTGFDADMELLQLIHSGKLGDSRIGRYLGALRQSFRSAVVADMLCYVGIQAELAMRAKGAFLMQSSGFPVRPDPQVREKFEELRYLERQIGRTGRQAIAPFIHTRSHDLWQLSRLMAR